MSDAGLLHNFCPNGNLCRANRVFCCNICNRCHEEVLEETGCAFLCGTCRAPMLFLGWTCEASVMEVMAEGPKRVVVCE